jgi:endo-1,4-beta-D-glucanase Y
MGAGLKEPSRLAIFVIAFAGKSWTHMSLQHSSLRANLMAEFWAIGMRMLVNKVDSTFDGNYFLAIHYNHA